MPNLFNPYRLFVGAMVPNWLMSRTEISQGAKLCYARLAQFAGEAGVAYPYQETLAKELGVSDRQIRSYIDELTRNGLVCEKRIGKGRPNEYSFVTHDWMRSGVKLNHTSSQQPVKQDSDRKDTSGQERKNTSGPIPKENQGKRIIFDNYSTKVKKDLELLFSMAEGGDDEEYVASWAGFLESRHTNHGTTLTERAYKIMANKLEGKTREQRIAMLDYSTENGYRTVFEVPQHRQRTQPMSAQDEVEQMRKMREASCQ